MATVDPTTYELDFTAEAGSHLDAVLNIEGFTLSGPKAHTTLTLTLTHLQWAQGTHKPASV